jgi:hypothetical protein
MWMSYADAAPYLGYGHARAMANANWDPRVWTHLARQDGTYLADNADRNHVFQRDNPALISLITAFGYGFPDAKPLAWRLRPHELEMLLGTRPSTAQFRLRLTERLETLERNAEDLHPGDPSYQFVMNAVQVLRSQLERLYA